jgi:hypothetical protein
MPSATDIYNELKGANTRLDGVNGRLDAVNGKLDALKTAIDAVRNAVGQVDQTLQWGFTQLITLGNYTNDALAHNGHQNDTMICILEHISHNTCELLNEAHLQTALQTVIEDKTTMLADLFAATHAEAALTREREETLRAQIEECCPPETPDPACRYEHCPKPGSLREPPRIDPRPPRHPEGPP